MNGNDVNKINNNAKESSVYTKAARADFLLSYLFHFSEKSSVKVRRITINMT